MTQLANRAANEIQAWKDSVAASDKAQVAESMKSHNFAIQARAKAIFKAVKSSSSSRTPDEPCITCFGDANADADIYCSVNRELLAFFEYIPEGLKFSNAEIGELISQNREAMEAAGHPALPSDLAADFDWAVLANVLMNTPEYNEGDIAPRQAMAMEPLRPFHKIASPEELRRKKGFAPAPAPTPTSAMPPQMQAGPSSSGSYHHEEDSSWPGPTTHALRSDRLGGGCAAASLATLSLSHPTSHPSYMMVPTGDDDARGSSFVGVGGHQLVYEGYVDEYDHQLSLQLNAPIPAISAFGS